MQREIRHSGADRVEARSSPLRLDRCAEWTSTNASPFDFGHRGVLPDAYRDDFWLYEELGARIWMHRDNERDPTRPLVFVLEMPDEAMEQRRPRSTHADLLGHSHAGTVCEVRVSAPARRRCRHTPDRRSRTRADRTT